MFKPSFFAGVACLAAAMPLAIADTLYVADSSSRSIVSSDLSGQNETTVVSAITGNVGDLFGLTSSGTTLYWTLSSSGLVQSYDLQNGTKLTLATSSQPMGIAVAGSYLYWVDATADALYRSNLDGSNSGQLITSSSGLFADPSGLTVTNSAIYWTDVGTGQIMQADLNGGNAHALVTGLSRPTAVAVDGAFIYWAIEGVGPGNAGKVQRANLADGSGVLDLVTGVYRPEGLMVADSTLYWSETQLGIGRANLDGSNQSYVITDLSAPTGMVIVAVPEPSVLALLGVGAWMGWRRRRASAQ
jgi:hypothetical protein